MVQFTDVLNSSPRIALMFFKAFFLTRAENIAEKEEKLPNPDVKCTVLARIIGLVCLTMPLSTASQTTNLTLQQAIEIGLNNNHGILIARNDAAVAENDASLGNAGFLPVIDGNGSASKTVFDTRQEFASGNISERDGARTTALVSNVALNWTLFDGFNMFTSHKQLNTLRDIGIINAQAEVENTVADIIAAYNNIVQQQQLLNALADAIDISREREEIARGLYAIGAGSRLEWNRARVDLIADSSAYFRQDALWANAKVELNRLLARTSDVQFEIADSIDIKTNLSFDMLLEAAKSGSKQAQIAEKNIRLARLGLRAARSQYYPELSLNMGYELSRTESNAGFFLFNRNRRFNYGLSLRWNLFDGFNTRRQEQNASIDIRSSELAFQEVQNLIDTELTQIHKRYTASLRIVQLEAENIQLARQNAGIALEQFRLGAITSVDLREVQNTFIDSETRFLLAQLEAKIAETELLRLSGQLIK
jgi:outer membrane protein TolC